MVVVLWLVWELLVLLVVLVLVLFLVLVVVFMYFWQYSKISCVVCCCRPRLLWVSTTDRRFSSDQPCSASRRTLRAYTTPSSVQTRCSSVRSLLPTHTPDFHLSASFGAGSPDPFPTSGRCARNSFSKFHLLSSVRSTHGTIVRGLCIVASETRDEPGCVSDDPLHQSTVSGRSVLCALALPPTLCALVPAIVSDSFQLLLFSNVIVLEIFGWLFVLVVWI